jgi:hypothetical protein
MWAHECKTSAADGIPLGLQKRLVDSKRPPLVHRKEGRGDFGQVLADFEERRLEAIPCRDIRLVVTRRLPLLRVLMLQDYQRECERRERAGHTPPASRRMPNV